MWGEPASLLPVHSGNVPQPLVLTQPLHCPEAHSQQPLPHGEGPQHPDHLHSRLQLSRLAEGSKTCITWDTEVARKVWPRHTVLQLARPDDLAFVMSWELLGRCPRIQGP